MKKILVPLLFLCTISDFLIAQDTITVFYNDKWAEIANKSDAAYFRKAYEDGRKVWIVNDYYISNKIQMTGTYKSKKFVTRHGHFIYYHENGCKSSEGDYVNNKAEGLWNIWLDNGQIKSTGDYKDGLSDGLWEYWYDSGEKKSEGKYLNGEKVGIWNYLYPNGQLKCRETYGKGGLCTYEGFFENGAMSFKGNSVNGRNQGEWTYWNSDGRITLKGSFSHGLRDGEWIRSFRDSEMKILFKNGVREGKQLGSVFINK
jgi:uncharacterized protein